MTEIVRKNNKHYPDWLEELARDTYGYIVNTKGAVKDENGNINIFFSVAEWAKWAGFVDEVDDGKGGKVEKVRQVNDLWQAVKKEMIRQGYHISVEPLHGHYIGDKGDEATNVLLQYYQILGRTKTAKEYLEYFLTCTDPELRELVLKQITAGLPDDVSIADLLHTFDKVLEAGGPTQLSILTLYLNGGIDPDSDLKDAAR